MKSIKENTELFNVTAYCSCKDCSEQYGTKTSTGTTAIEGRTIAVDPTVIPYGTKVLIKGNVYTAEDCGSLIKGKDIDIYFESHKDVEAFGRKKLEVIYEH